MVLQKFRIEIQCEKCYNNESIYHFLDEIDNVFSSNISFSNFHFENEILTIILSFEQNILYSSTIKRLLNLAGLKLINITKYPPR